MRLKNKVVLVTGASGGIGRAIVNSLAEQEACLIITGRNQKALDEITQSVLGKGGICQSVAADLTTTEGLLAVERAVKKSTNTETGGQLDVLINNAGVSEFDAFDGNNGMSIESMMQINLVSPMRLTQQILPYLKTSDRGLIVNMGSTFGSIGYPGFTSYCASKFGLRGFSESLSRELADTTVGVLYFAPRATQTAINSQQVMEMNVALGVKSDSPEWVAGQVINAIQKEHRRVYLGWPEKLFVRINALLPGVVASSIIKQLPIIRHYLKRRQSA